MVPEFETAVVAMEVGAGLRRRCKSQFGWHLIKLNEKRETTPPPLEQARPEIENQLRQEALRGASSPSCAPRPTIEKPETGTPPAAIRESDLLTN